MASAKQKATELFIALGFEYRCQQETPRATFVDILYRCDMTARVADEIVGIARHRGATLIGWARMVKPTDLSGIASAVEEAQNIADEEPPEESQPLPDFLGKPMTFWATRTR